MALFTGMTEPQIFFNIAILTLVVLAITTEVSSYLYYKIIEWLEKRGK